MTSQCSSDIDPILAVVDERVIEMLYNGCKKLKEGVGDSARDLVSRLFDRRAHGHMHFQTHNPYTSSLAVLIKQQTSSC